MNDIPKHKVFISYHHEKDEEYKRRLVQALNAKVVDKSVSPGDIHPEGLHIDEIRRRIRDDHIADSEVTVVLIGRCSWQRKHIDWEISASLIDRRNNERCGVIGVILPTHPYYRSKAKKRNRRRFPPRLVPNMEGDSPFVTTVRWPRRRVARRLLPKIHQAFVRKDRTPWPDDSYEPYGDNHSGSCERGWQN